MLSYIKPSNINIITVTYEQLRVKKFNFNLFKIFIVRLDK